MERSYICCRRQFRCQD